ncbi:MAG: thiamine phosphate synthase [Sulfurospirillaceae bacterium]|nr:thiamine phosphate synthase [Sulfurospirillaceae bacterium]
MLDKATLAKKGYSIERFISTCKALHVSMIQYRNKLGDVEEQKTDLLSIKSLLPSTPLIVNDRIDLVYLCDGLHLGQEDIVSFSLSKKEAINYVRGVIGDKILGISTHNKEEILEANTLDVDYVGLGAYRATSTKSDAVVLKEKLGLIAGFSLKPVVAIGGVLRDDVIENVAYNAIGSGLYED